MMASEEFEKRGRVQLLIILGFLNTNKLFLRGDEEIEPQKRGDGAEQPARPEGFGHGQQAALVALANGALQKVAVV